jgi:hypothetical protein
MKPTYLYIKQHSVTGKCYFGKTTRSDPEHYLGSGVYWLRHVRKHGKEHVVTLWYKLFTDQAECTRVALLFSEQQDIVKSDLWLNLNPENGLDGRSIGYHHSEETLKKMSKPKTPEHCKNLSIAGAGKKLPPEVCAKMSISRTGKTRDFTDTHCENLSKAAKNRTSEWNEKQSLAQKGKKHSLITCPHCLKTGGSGGMKVHHFDHCKART